MMSRCLKSILYFSVFLLLASLFISPLVYAEQVLRYGIMHADIGGMDPHRAPATNDKMLVDSLYNGLVRFRPGNMNPDYIEPDLAKEWEVSDDGLVWTFYLREGVQFHKGFGELTAEDVVFSLEKAGDPERSVFASDYRFIKELTAVDPYTVRMTLHDPLPEIQVLGYLTDYQGGMIVSKNAVLEYGDDFRMNPIGTGPFYLEHYEPRSYVLLARNEEYFRGAPILSKIEYRFMPEPRSLQLAFEACELDVIEGLREDWWVEDISGPGIEVDIVGPGEMLVIHFNLSRPPLDNLLVRKALAYAIDRDELREVIGESVTIPAYSPVPPGYYASTDDVKRYDHDPQRVQELLAEAGFPDGLRLGEAIVTEMDAMILPMEIIHDQLARQNIHFDMQVVDHSTFHSLIRDNLSSLIIYGAARFPIPDPYLTQFYHSRSTVQTPTAVTNFSHYGKLLPGVDDLIDGARRELDSDKQREMWIQAQQQIMEDLPAYPLYVLMLEFDRKEYVDLGYEFESTLSLTTQFTEKTRLLNH